MVCRALRALRPLRIATQTLSFSFKRLISAASLTFTSCTIHRSAEGCVHFGRYASPPTLVLQATHSSCIAHLYLLHHLPSPNNCRALRALRPLRIATQLDGIRVIVLAIVLAFPAVMEVILVASLFYFIFAVLGVNLLAGER